TQGGRDPSAAVAAGADPSLKETARSHSGNGAKDSAPYRIGRDFPDAIRRAAATTCSIARPSYSREMLSRLAARTRALTTWRLSRWNGGSGFDRRTALRN